MNSSKCKKCYYWDVKRANYSNDVKKFTNGYAKKPCKLSLSSHHNKSKETCNKLVNGKTNRTLAMMQLKTLGSNNDVVTLIIDSAHIRNAMNNNNLEMLNLNSFHNSTDRSNLHGIGYPDFSMCQMKNLKH